MGGVEAGPERAGMRPLRERERFTAKSWLGKVGLGGEPVAFHTVQGT